MYSVWMWNQLFPLFRLHTIWIMINVGSMIITYFCIISRPVILFDALVRDRGEFFPTVCAHRLLDLLGWASHTRLEKRAQTVNYFVSSLWHLMRALKMLRDFCSSFRYNCRLRTQVDETKVKIFCFLNKFNFNCYRYKNYNYLIFLYKMRIICNKTNLSCTHL